jgi:protein-S-isoprenylcysteine O-methyltransferase Ste14
MDELLNALGIRGRMARAVTPIAIWLGFSAATVGLAAGQAALEYWTEIDAVGTIVVVGLVWAAWTLWHSVLFLNHRQRYLANAAVPYRQAFFVDLVPGLSVSFSQMLRPALNGETLHKGRTLPPLPQSWLETVCTSVGLLLSVGSVVLFAVAWKTLGTARIGFVREFVAPEAFEPLREGLYACVRHPLFWSGIFFSCALGILWHSPAAIGVAVVNTIYALVYNSLEDKRLQLIFGERYGTYARAVPWIVPLRAGRTWSSAATGVSGFNTVTRRRS